MRRSRTSLSFRRWRAEEEAADALHVRATAAKATTLLARNPGLFCRVMAGKLSAVRRMPPLPVLRRIKEVSFEYDLAGYHGTAPMYFGSYAPVVVDAMKHVLKPGDIFFDVGANIGYLSAVAAGLVGTQGQVHCFEPVPAYFARLKRFAELNPEYAIHANCCAAGETQTTRPIYVTKEAGQSTLVSSYRSAAEIERTEQIPLVRLDSYIESKGIDRVTLIKIDAEGYEFPVLKGLRNYLQSTGCRPAIICEIAPRVYALMGSSLRELVRYMEGFGYRALDLADGTSPVDLCAIRHVEDVLFLAKGAA